MSDHNKTLSIVAVFLGLGSAGLSLYNLKTINSLSANHTTMSGKLTKCENDLIEIRSKYVDLTNKDKTLEGNINDNKDDIKVLKNTTRDLTSKVDAILQYMDKKGEKIEIPKRTKKHKKKKKSKSYDSDSDSDTDSDSDSDSDSDDGDIINRVNKSKPKRK